MKKVLVLLLAAGVIVSSSFCKAKNKSGKEVVRIAIEGGWKPYNFVDENGKITGFDVDVVNAIAERIPDISFQKKEGASSFPSKRFFTVFGS